MNLYDATIPVFTKLLRQVDRWLDKAVASAEQRKFDPEILLGARLAPDQYSLLRQIQAACDQAKLTAAKLAGKEPPSHPDTEKTIAELRARIATCVKYVESVPQAAYNGAEARRVAPAWLQGKWMRGDDYLTQVGAPNFYFHVAMAYAILRHNGVELGKMDYIGGLPLQEG